MIAPAVFWPAALGCGFLAVGIYTYRRDLLAPSLPLGARFVAWGPVLVAASLAAFAGEHFTAAKDLSALVPKWLPARLGITYFVGCAHLAAASSFVARRYIRWSAFFLAVMFVLFVLLLHLPGAVAHPHTRIFWIVTFRETTFAMGALALFGFQVRDRWPKHANTLAVMAGLWTGIVLIFFGIEHFLHPTYSPGVPDSKLTPPWVPLPLLIAYVIGVLLVVLGLAMFVRKYAGRAATLAGLLMLLLTAAMYVPEFFLAHGIPQQVIGINFVFDTMLFAGTMLLVARAASWATSQAAMASQAVSV